jgi:hypothetical protein
MTTKSVTRVTPAQRRRIYAAVWFFPSTSATEMFMGSDGAPLPIRVVDGEECVVITRGRPHQLERRYNYIGYAVRIEVGRGWLVRSDANAVEEAQERASR